MKLSKMAAISILAKFVFLTIAGFAILIYAAFTLSFNHAIVGLFCLVWAEVVFIEIKLENMKK